MRMGRKQLALVLTLGLALIASIGVIVRLSKRLAFLDRQQTADLQSLHQLREALHQPELQASPTEAERPSPVGAYLAELAKRDATIKQVNQGLSETQANVQELQAQLSSSNDEHQKALAAADQLRQKEHEEWQSQLDSLKQELDSAQAESQASRQRLAALEADNAKLISDNSAASARAAEFARAVAQLQELDSRRDVHLTSIMRRYRDITSQFRAMSGVLGSSRESNASSPFSDAALTSIQSAVSSADDDLRQLSELNAQARQLEKKLAKK